MSCGRGLQVRGRDDSEFSSKVLVKFSGGEPFQTISVDIWLLCALENKKEFVFYFAKIHIMKDLVKNVPEYYSYINEKLDIKTNSLL